MLTVHSLKRAESIEMLSARYRVPVCMIMRANGIKTEKDLERRRRVNIPRLCYCNRCGIDEESDWKRVVAAPGDTLYSIARRHCVTMNILMKANNLESPDSIREGDQIRVPVITGEVYSVREGETIEDIAKRRGLTASHIRETNGLAPNAAVFAGMRLVLD